MSDSKHDQVDESKSPIVEFAKLLCKGKEPLPDVVHYKDDDDQIIAGEVKLASGKVFYLLLYNGHFWNSETGIEVYLGPNAEIAALCARQRIVESMDDYDESLELDDDEDELLRSIFEDDGWDDFDEDDCIEVRVKKYNPEPMGPTIGKPTMNPPKEWKERIDEGLAKWVSYNHFTGERKPAYRDPEGFGMIANRIQEIIGTKVGLEIYRHEDGEEYAAEIHLGYDKNGDMVTSYLAKVGGLYYDTNSGQILESLGVTPKIVAEVFLERMGCYEFPENEDEHEFFWSETPFEKDMENHRHDPNAKFYIPEEWSEMIAKGQRESDEMFKKTSVNETREEP